VTVREDQSVHDTGFGVHLLACGTCAAIVVTIAGRGDGIGGSKDSAPLPCRICGEPADDDVAVYAAGEDWRLLVRDGVQNLADGTGLLPQGRFVTLEKVGADEGYDVESAMALQREVVRFVYALADEREFGPASLRPALSFRTWLGHFVREESPIGDLARDAAADPSFPDGVGYRQEFTDYLMDEHGVGVGSRALDVVEDAYSRFRRAKALRVPQFDAAALPDCACGWGRYDPEGKHDGQAHRRKHLAWSAGLPVPKALLGEWSGRIAVVADDAPMPWQRLAYECARIARADGGYDGAAFPYPARTRTRSGRFAEPATLALLMRTDSTREPAHVVGMLFTSDDPVAGWLDIATDEHQSFPAGPGRSIRPTVAVTFTAVGYRRQGIASALVRALADYRGVSVTELSWLTPLSEPGKALAAKLNQASDRIWLS